MNNPERLKILDRMLLLQHREAENVVKHQDLFLPLAMHEIALRPEKVVVIGARGAGKSALFQLLQRSPDDLERLFGKNRVPKAVWLDAFSEQSKEHPQVPELDELARAVDDEGLRLFWMGHLHERLAAAGVGLTAPEASLRRNRLPLVKWVEALRGQVGTLAKALDDADSVLADRGQTVFAAYDHIDRLGEHDSKKRARFASTLLSMWLSLSNRFRNLRAKVFLRQDVFEDAERAFADATKLRPRAAPLEWDVESLYRLVVRHLANDPGDAEAGSVDTCRTWLSGIADLDFKKGPLGWVPGPMPEKVQKSFATALAGEFMGKGEKKGRTYRWIPNRLQDAQVRIVPRSILSLIGYGARYARKKPLNRGPRIMTPENLAAALPETSLHRVAEIGEEYKIVKRLEQLKGKKVPMTREEAIAGITRPLEDERPKLTTDGELVFDELVRLGVLKVRDDRRVDVPDIYRYGYGIKRKGGVAQPK